MTIDEMAKELDLEPEVINEIIKKFQKTGKKYSGIQLAVALTILLSFLIQNDSQRQVVDAIVNSYDIDVEAKNE